jgi:two-component system, NarL family, sensor histidine kinase UhpB
MSLQFRVLGSIALLLVLALLCGGALLSWHARSVVEIEVRTAFQGAENSVRDTLESDVQHTVTMRQVVSSFEGQRHVRAALINEKNKVIVSSEIGRLQDPAPLWFARLMMPPTMSARFNITLPQYPCVVELTSDPRSEIAEVWDHVRDAFTVMILFCGATLAIVSLAVAYALRFFRRFQTGLLAVSDGGYDARLEAKGPPEFAALAQGFNHMAARLETFSQSNQRLERQIHSVQEEERAGIARDLHDEVGPYLFAIQVDANVVAKSPDSEVRKLGGAIREAAQHVQNHVKEILRQLRPVSSLDFGLEPAIADLIAFWSRRHPDIRFERAVAATPGLDRRGEDVAYRIVQESISNAVRHGKPQKIQITVSDAPDQVTISVIDDGGGLNQNKSPAISLGRIGLAGMQERLRALGGGLMVEEIRDHGVCIRAFLPKIRKLEIA